MSLTRQLIAGVAALALMAAACSDDDDGDSASDTTEAGSESSETGETVTIDVIDSGPGIPEGVQSKLFTPFFTTKSRGTGLGLATVKRIAEAHHGDVRVMSSTGAGTTMRFSLPLRPPGAPELD